MILHAALFALFSQGKIAPVEADRLVRQSNLCILVKPEKNHPRVAVTRVVWGSGLKPGDRILLKGYVHRDYVGGPNAEKESDVMTYAIDGRSLVFLEAAPRGVSLGPGERFALLPMIAFGGRRHDCTLDFSIPKRLAVGGVLFSPSTKRSQRDSVSLDETIKELNRIRSSQPALSLLVHGRRRNLK